MKVTSKDIADKLGISQSTVSLALRNDPRIKDETRKRVTEMADELGYTPSQVSRDLISGKTKTIAVMVGYRVFEHVGRMLSGIAEAANEQAYSIKLLVLDGTRDVSEFACQCLKYRVAGVIAIGLRTQSAQQLHAMMRKNHTPLVLLDSNALDLPCTHVLANDREGGQWVAEYLVQLGHRHMAVLTGHTESSVANRRTASFWDTVSALLNEPDLPRPTELGQHINDVAEHKTRKLLETQPNLTALFCTTDFMAAVAIRVAHGMGLRVPEDLSIVGYGNLMVSELSDPALTTVDEPFAKMGEAAMKRVLQQIEQPHAKSQTEPVEILLPTELIVRDSTTRAASVIA
jgi:DNA-binding LacI/PurR family transcriptional regulator